MIDEEFDVLSSKESNNAKDFYRAEGLSCVPMVLLTITPAIMAAVKVCNELKLAFDEVDGTEEPSLDDPAVGKPISHTQLIALSKTLQKHEELEHRVLCHLDELLRGSRIYYEPPEPKAEPTTEYKTLMARLRREEEARSYERMINPPLPLETFEQRFPRSTNAKLFNPSEADIGQDDEMSYADLNRQLALIINILVSIVACSVAIWMAARHWNAPMRLALSMGGSGMIGVAEVVVYAGYLRRLKEAKEKGRKQIETKEIVKTWIIGGEDEKQADDEPISIASESVPDELVRRRIIKPK